MSGDTTYLSDDDRPLASSSPVKSTVNGYINGKNAKHSDVDMDDDDDDDDDLPLVCFQVVTSWHVQTN